jgi:hypothetical protein
LCIEQCSYLIIVHTFAVGVAVVDEDEKMSVKRDYFHDLLQQPQQLLLLEITVVDVEQLHLLFHMQGYALLELLHQTWDEALLLQLMLLPFVVELLPLPELLDGGDGGT